MSGIIEEGKQDDDDLEQETKVNEEKLDFPVLIKEDGGKGEDKRNRNQEQEWEGYPEIQSQRRGNKVLNTGNEKQVGSLDITDVSGYRHKEKQDACDHHA